MSFYKHASGNYTSSAKITDRWKLKLEFVNVNSCDPSQKKRLNNPLFSQNIAKVRPKSTLFDKLHTVRAPL